MRAKFVGNFMLSQRRIASIPIHSRNNTRRIMKIACLGHEDTSPGKLEFCSHFSPICFPPYTYLTYTFARREYISIFSSLHGYIIRLTIGMVGTGAHFVRCSRCVVCREQHFALLRFLLLCIRKFDAFACWLLGWEILWLWEKSRNFFVSHYYEHLIFLRFFNNAFHFIYCFGFSSMIYGATRRLAIQFMAKSCNYIF